MKLLAMTSAVRRLGAVGGCYRAHWSFGYDLSLGRALDGVPFQTFSKMPSGEKSVQLSTGQDTGTGGGWLAAFLKSFAASGLDFQASYCSSNSASSSAVKSVLAILNIVFSSSLAW